MKERETLGAVQGALPCPFCGGEPIAERGLRDGYEKNKKDPDAYYYVLRCPSCAAEGGWSKSSATGARGMWNLRTQFGGDDQRRFVIWDTTSKERGCALFWRPNEGGYTYDLREAGRYTEKEARGHRATDVAVPILTAEKCAEFHVDLKTLVKTLGQSAMPKRGRRR